MTTIALFGAAGKMGTRISEKLQDAEQYRVLYVEAGEAGIGRLRARGTEPTPSDVAAREADVAILAIPDVVIGRVAREIVPQMKRGAMVICLDPAAPHGGELPERQDITYFITHPCHPPVANDETTPEARKDFFGGIAKQDIVCALMQGPEEHYALGEAVCRRIFAPVRNAHRITVEQMAILEPAMAETTVLTLMAAVKEAMDEAIARGVPADAARDFLFGHLNVNIGILFGLIDAEISDGAKLAMARARDKILQPDWKEVFEPENVYAEVRAITQAISRA
jgi:D-apionate oxidoisomerase